MGYTHYWNQVRSFTDDQWVEVTTDISDILSYVENELGVPLADSEGSGGTRPQFDSKHIMFNGLGDDSHETFIISRKRGKAREGGQIGRDFCKTARKPYDVAVTACLCYLATVADTHSVASDGNGGNFLDGLGAACKALPRKANVLDVPVDVMRDDRWTGPFVHVSNKSGYSVRFCVDGKGYVERGNGKEWYRFDTQEDLAKFLDTCKHASFKRGGNTSFGFYPAHEPNIWAASGSFDKARHDRIAGAQTKALSTLFPAGAEHAFPPPAYIRPGEFPRPEEEGSFCYSLSDLLAKIAA